MLLNDSNKLRQVIDDTHLEPFVPKKKVVVTDESVSKEEAMKTNTDNDEEDYDTKLKGWCDSLSKSLKAEPVRVTIEFGRYFVELFFL